MDYFLNGVLSESNTPIEVKMLQRLTTFQELGRTAKVVLCGYSVNSYTFIQQHHLEKNVVSCYDWLQEVAEFKKPALRRDDLPQLDNYQRENAKGGYAYLAANRMAARSYVNKRGQITHVNYYDESEQRLETDQYDLRGFLSRKQFFNVQQELVGEQYLNPAGQVCLDVAYAQKQPVYFNLIRKQRVFTEQQAFWQYCLAHILVDPEVVISERREYDQLLKKIPGKLRIVRLYNANFDGDESIAQIFLIRKQAQFVNTHTVLFDEYTVSATELKQTWQQILTTNL